MMESNNIWYDKVAKEINTYQDSLNKKVSKKYKLDLLLRIAKRVGDFSSTCGQCQLFQQEITTLTKELSYLLQMPNKVSLSGFFIGHLK